MAGPHAETLVARTPTLDIAYEASGAAGGVPVILLHGFPDDVRAYDSVAPPLAGAGYRVLVPYLRGYGPTRFLDSEAPRMAQQAAIGQDLLDFMDALGIERAALAGYDWGGRAACIAAILAPERVRALVTIGGYNVQDTLAPAAPGPARAGARVLVPVVLQHRARAARARGQPPRDLPAAVAGLVAQLPLRRRDVRAHRRRRSTTPTSSTVVIHSYRHRHGNAPGDPRFDAIERRLATRPPITVPTIILHGGDDGVSLQRRSDARAAALSRRDREPRDRRRRPLPAARKTRRPRPGERPPHPSPPMTPTSSGDLVGRAARARWAVVAPAAHFRWLPVGAALAPGWLGAPPTFRLAAT